jgi:hypothetical protein
MYRDGCFLFTGPIQHSTFFLLFRKSNGILTMTLMTLNVLFLNMSQFLILYRSRHVCYASILLLTLKAITKHCFVVYFLIFKLHEVRHIRRVHGIIMNFVFAGIPINRGNTGMSTFRGEKFIFA